MSESIPMENVAKKFEKHEYGVIYLDILGQKELMKKLEVEEVNPEDEEKMQKVLKYIKTFLREVRSIREGVAPEKAPILYEYYIKNRVDGIDYEEFEASLKELVFGIQQFSDTTMVYIRLDGEHPFMARQLFSRLLCTLESSLFQALKEGIFIRGAITKGFGWEIEPNNLYGPVIRDASKLELTEPKWSRVVVSNEVVDLYRNVLHAYENEEQDYAQEIQLIKSTFIKGSDGECQLALFPLCVLQLNAKKDNDRERPRRTVKHFLKVLQEVDVNLKSHQARLKSGKDDVEEMEKLIKRGNFFKQEIMSGVLTFINLCKNEDSLSKEECVEFEDQIKTERHEDIGYCEPLRSIFED